MKEKKLVHRSDVPTQYTWDLSALFQTEEDYRDSIKKVIQDAHAFAGKYKGNLTDAATINACLDEYKAILEHWGHLEAYTHLSSSADRADAVNTQRHGEFQLTQADISKTISFVSAELNYVEDPILEEAMALSTENKHALEDIVRQKPHFLPYDIEETLSQFAHIFNAPYNTYNLSKMVDMTFDSFTANDQSLPLSFVLFENEWEYETDHTIRKNAFQAFYDTLSQYQNTFASLYQTRVLTEKVFSEIKQFPNTIDHLLFNQKVSADMHDRQIDLIMEHLSGPMRKYAQLLQKTHHLETMTFADLKLVVDPEFEPTISIEESKERVKAGLAVLGDDYLEMIDRAYDERWIDFPQNIGKSTGAFCNSPYGAHPYILISWTEKMREVFVLAHELGHAGHFYLAGQHQNILNTRPSLYMIEAPSTMNELLVANHLMTQADNPRMKRWVLSSLISRTYYHNFVTHLLEAAFQREVYRRIDASLPLSASVLNELKRKILTQFWGDDVVINDGAELTWMRQPHYYMGLYPYTYSAGLTLATESNRKLLNEEITIDMWKDLLKAGGTKTPLELARIVDVDLSTDQPLLNTIAAISDMIDEIIELSEIIENS